MAKGQFKFHGAFKSKTDAKKRERKVDGFIKTIKVGGQRRYSVMTRKGK